MNMKFFFSCFFIPTFILYVKRLRRLPQANIRVYMHSPCLLCLTIESRRDLFFHFGSEVLVRFGRFAFAKTISLRDNAQRVGRVGDGHGWMETRVFDVHLKGD